MKKLLILITMMLMVCSISAQNEKTAVCIGQFKNNSNKSEVLVRTLRSQIIDGINDKGRLMLVDLTTLGDMPSSKNEMLKVLNGKGIEFLIEGTLDAVSSKKGDQYYEAEVNYSLTIIDTETGVTKGTEAYKDTWSIGGNNDEAILKALGRAKDHMPKFVDDNFKLTAAIKELDQVDAKKGVKTCYISIGSAQGIAKGQLLEVFAKMEVAGEKIDKKIGELKAKEVLSPTLTLCEVKSGGVDIQKNFENKIPLTVISRAANGGLFEKMNKGLDKVLQ
jgi:hypothetical protein